MEYFDEEEKIESFWEWFVANEARIVAIIEDSSGREEQELEMLEKALNNQVLRLGMFTWEIGYGEERPFYLTISPNGSRELLAQSREIMNYAPNRPDWEFNPAQPAKEWDLRFSLLDEDALVREVNAADWRFVLQPKGARQADIVLEARDIAQLDNETRATAANVVVTSLLGEAQRIEHVREIHVQASLDDQQKKIAKSVLLLKDTFEAQIS